MDRLIAELHDTLGQVRLRFPTVPLLDRRYDSSAVQFKLMPAQLLNILSESDSYQPLVPGGDPTWFKIVTQDSVIELVVYRTLTDDQLYMLGPPRPTLQ